MEATIGTLAASNSIDLTEQIESTNNIISSSTASAPEDFEGKRIMAGVNIVTGGCGTYAVTSKNGVTVYPWKTTKAEEVATMTQKENDIPPFLPTDTKPLSLTTTPSTHPQSLDHIFYAVTRLPVSSSIHPILKSWSSSSSDPLPKSQDKLFYNPVNGLDNNNSRATTAATNSNYNFARRSNFRLKFADRVQVVEMESDGWAKLARGNGYILAEHGQGSDLVKVGGPKDKACLIEGMMYSVLRRYITLQKDQDELIRILEGLRKDLNFALLEHKDCTIVAAEHVLASDSTDGSSLSNHQRDNSASQVSAASATKEDNGMEARSEEEEDDSFYPTKQQSGINSHGDGKGAEPKNASSSFIENLPVIGRFVCGGLSQAKEETAAEAQRNNRAATSSPRPSAAVHSSERRHVSTPDAEVRAAHREDNNSLSSAGGYGIDFRTGMSGHRALLSSHSASKEMTLISRNPNPRFMSVHSGIGYTRRRPWNKASVEASFASFPGVRRRPITGISSAASTPNTAMASIADIRRSASDDGRISSHTPTPISDCSSNNFVARIPVARLPSSSVSGSSKQPSRSCSPPISSVGESLLHRNGTPLHRLDNLINE